MPWTALVILALNAAATPPAGDGKSASAGPLRPRLEIVEQGVGDRGGLVTSTRVLPVDLRLPSGFGVVYRSPEGDGNLMRGNGALFAVFPRSLYRSSAVGAIPVVPAGVVYSIGMPGPVSYPGGALQEKPAAGEQPEEERPTARIDLRMRPKPIASPHASGGEVPWSGSHRDSPAVVDPMPPISAAARARPSQEPAERPAPVIDLRLGPPVLVRE